MPTTPEARVTVSQRALAARIRRVLGKEGATLRACRPNQRAFGDFGNWYIVNSRNYVEAAHCNLQALGQELQALRPYEVVE